MAASGQSYHAIYIYSEYANAWGVYRSSDGGATWDFLVDYPLGIMDDVTTLDSDKTTFGKLYLGFQGHGFAYGTQTGSGSGSAPVAPTGLTNGTTYYFVVIATNANGTSGNFSQGGATPASGGGSNLALNKTASADSSQSGNGASNGNDGSLSTKWAANDWFTGHWWQVDLGASHSLTSFQVYWEQNAAYQYKIQVSSDGSTWTTAVDKTANTTASSHTTDNASASGRYVRITITGGVNSGTWASFYEFQAIGN